MQWGLMNIPISSINKKHQAILLAKGSSNTFNSTITEAVAKESPYYDFYLNRDVDYDSWYFSSQSVYNDLIHSHNGVDFCNEIITAANVSYLDLGSEIT